MARNKQSDPRLRTTISIREDVFRALKKVRHEMGYMEFDVTNWTDVFSLLVQIYELSKKSSTIHSLKALMDAQKRGS